jgi:hypothetical protein
MKYIITETQFKLKIYDKFLDMLINETKIFGGKKYKYMKYNYVAFIKYPFSKDGTFYDLAFNSSDEFTFTTPGGFRMGEWVKMIGIDYSKSMELSYSLWEEYTDRLEEKIKNYIDDYINQTKNTITESRVNEVIINYFNQRLHPDYDVGFELYDFYQDEIKAFGSYTFTIEDREAYIYFGEYGGFKNRLLIEDWIYDDLSQKFGKKWIPLFKEWFEEKTGLEVYRMLLPGEYI